MNRLTVNNALYGGVLFNLLNLGLKAGVFDYISRVQGNVHISQICKELYICTIL